LAIIKVKKAFSTILGVTVILAAILLYRAETVFKDRQAEPATDYIDVAFDDEGAVQHFAQALTYPTVSYDDRDNFDAAAFLGFQDFLQNTYPRVNEHTKRTVVNGFSVVYHLAGTDPSLEPVLFMSHMDVVPVQEDTLGEWTHPPFNGTIDDGFVWGRGSLDDKVGVIALMESLELLLAEGFQPKRSIYLAFGHDEEVSGRDGAAKIAEHFAKQGVRFDFVLDEGGAITQDMMEGITRPLAVIGVSEKGYVNLELTVNAAGGHSSEPPAHTALGILSHAIVKIEDNPFAPRLDFLLMTFEEIGYYMPFDKRLAMGNLWLLSPLVEHIMLSDKASAASMRTTTAATMASGSPKSNILPTRATAVINFRILPGETVDSVQQRVEGLIDDERVQLSPHYGSDPSPVSPTDSRGYRILAQTLRAMDNNILVAPYMVRGGTDARNFYTLSPNVYRFLAVRMNPDTIQYFHGIDERIAVEDYLQAIRFYANVIRQASN
jgi:carboxypeptidase PM20D1